MTGDPSWAAAYGQDMDAVTRLPTTRASLDPIDRDLAEIDAAIGLVLGGLATRVRLVGLMRPDSTAAVGLARSQAAGIRFEMQHDPAGMTSVTVGPRLPAVGVDPSPISLRARSVAQSG